MEEEEKIERRTERTTCGVANLTYPQSCYFQDGTKDQIAVSAYRQLAIERLAAYEDTGLEPEEIKKHESAYNECLTRTYGPFKQKISKWLQAEQDGRLVVLPSKTVYELTWDAGPGCDLRCPVSVGESGLCDYCDKGKLFVYERPCTQELLKELGKTVFLTREEAEAALEGGKSNA